MNILCVPIKKLEQLEKFLEPLALQGFGRKQERYYIFPTNVGVTEDGHFDTALFNQFMNQCRTRHYTSVMFLTNS